MAYGPYTGTIHERASVPIEIDGVADTQADWTSVPNDSYFLSKVNDAGQNNLLYYKTSGGTVIPLFGLGTFGVCAIYDSAGAPTYYDDLDTAHTAASSGDTIHLLADHTVDSATTIDWKDGVDFQMNGHTLTHDSTTNDLFTDSGNITTNWYDGTIKRSVASNPSSKSLILFAGNQTEFYAHGVYLEMEVTNSDSFIAANFACKKIVGLRSRAIGNGEAIRQFLTSSGTECRDLYATTTAGARAILLYVANAYNCIGIGEGAGSEGLECQSVTAVNCTGIAEQAGNGISGSGTFINCTGRSSSGVGIANATEVDGGAYFSSTGTAVGTVTAIRNATIKTTTGAPMQFQTAGTIIQNNSLITAGNRCILLQGNDLIITGNSLINNWNNASGDGIYFGSTHTGSLVSNNTVKLSNAAADMFHSAGASSTVVAMNNVLDAPAGSVVYGLNMSAELIANDVDSNNNITIR